MEVQFIGGPYDGETRTLPDPNPDQVTLNIIPGGPIVDGMLLERIVYRLESQPSPEGVYTLRYETTTNKFPLPEERK